MNGACIILLSFGACAILLLWLALIDVPRVVRSLSRGRRAKGYIIRDEISYLRYCAVAHFPVVIFRDASGASFEVQTRHNKKTSAPEYMVDVEVAYLPENPQTSAVLVGIKYYYATIFNVLFILTFFVIAPIVFCYIFR